MGTTYTHQCDLCGATFTSGHKDELTLVKLTVERKCLTWTIEVCDTCLKGYMHSSKKRANLVHRILSMFGIKNSSQ